MSTFDTLKARWKSHWKTLTRREKLLFIIPAFFAFLILSKVTGFVSDDEISPGIRNAQIECQLQADRQAKYGAPRWPWGKSFEYRDTRFTTGDRMVLVEPDAQFQNGFGAYAHVAVRCTYDLAAKQVIDIQIGN